jgi:hypothetical protein
LEESKPTTSSTGVAYADSTAPGKTKKLTVGLPEQLVRDVLELAKNSNRTATDLIRFGLTLAKLYFQEKKKGNDLFIGDSNGKVLMKIVFPY